ncbi:hypothetical protein GCM10007216_14470 [Thalassobacillus devorans]|uniref:Uncharacterized protein n=1 Tax=Thalassobacillus devorans TaxID=279813 RepID=A0ABQ1NX67_9BACI|nr:hypothetical protein [Thalassobacillus devorans]GGC84889.1 hypothetical protein GCM10007216_14470 [Thalassobacillus devorans]
MGNFVSNRKLVKFLALLPIIIILYVNWQILSVWETTMSYLVCLLLDVLTVTFSVFMVYLADINRCKKEQSKRGSTIWENLKLKKLLEYTKCN